jgi:hypothetical protein
MKSLLRVSHFECKRPAFANFTFASSIAYIPLDKKCYQQAEHGVRVGAFLESASWTWQGAICFQLPARALPGRNKAESWSRAHQSPPQRRPRFISESGFQQWTLLARPVGWIEGFPIPQPPLLDVKCLQQGESYKVHRVLACPSCLSQTTRLYYTTLLECLVF